MTPMDSKIEQVVDSILSDYSGGRDIDRLEQLRFPDRDVVIDIVNKLRRIIYPGYFPDKSYKGYHTKPNLSVLIEDVMFHLTDQIKLVLQEQAEEDADRRAKEICLEFFSRIPKIRALVQTDLQAAYDGDPAATSPAEIIFSYPGMFAITVFRLAHELYLLGVPMLPRIMTEYAHNLTGIDIHPGATVDEYFFIDHGTGIVIGETTVIGKNVKVYQGVTLGGQSLRGKRRHPTIEDDVTIYAGASILGGDTVIGKGSVIGSNVFITESVAPGTSVINKKQELQYKTRG